MIGLEQEETLNYDISEFSNVLKEAWIKETSSGEWSEECPELNQCAVTALVIQDFFGGELLRCPTSRGSSHYWNRLPNGKEVDLTDSQFSYSKDVPLREESVIREREYVLSYPDTKARYELLLSRVMSLF